MQLRALIAVLQEVALSQSLPQPQPEGDRQQTLVLRLDLLHNWSDLIVLGFAIVFTTYMAIGEVIARGWSKDPGVYNHLSIFAPIAVGLSVMAWRRFGRVRLIVDEEQIEGVSVWGVRRRCRLEDLSEVELVGRPLARQLHFKREGTVAFKVWRNVWTGMQLGTLSVFLGLPVPGQNEPIRSRAAVWAGGLFARSWDALFLVMGGAVLAGAVTADRDAHAYNRAVAFCSVSQAVTGGNCYSVVPVTVAAIGVRSFNEYSLALRFYTRTYDTTAISDSSIYRKFRVDMTTHAKLWKGKLTLIQADANNWIYLTDNPLYREGWARTGLPTRIVALLGLVPILTRLHPVVT